jgi:membrane-associated phospholipid phosphatase
MPVSKVLRQQFLWIFGSGSVYLGLFLARPLWYTAHCQSAGPEDGPLREPLCSAAALNAMDRMIPGQGSISADFYSNCLQNGAGILAFFLPWIVFRKIRPALSLNLILLGITSLNGALMEVIRALIQRPRPIVLAAPASEAGNIHHYTSFYSGHTSFVALALFFSWLWTRRLLPEKRGLVLALGILYPALTVGTAVLRVLGGRHYPTDTLAGWLFGTALAAVLGRKMLDQLEEERLESGSSPSI